MLACPLQLARDLSAWLISPMSNCINGCSRKNRMSRGNVNLSRREILLSGESEQIVSRSLRQPLPQQCFKPKGTICRRNGNFNCRRVETQGNDESHGKKSDAGGRHRKFARTGILRSGFRASAGRTCGCATATSGCARGQGAGTSATPAATPEHPGCVEAEQRR
jgi:hypothetical protein